MSRNVDKIKEVSLISLEIRKIEKEDALNGTQDFRMRSYKNIKNLLNKRDVLMNEIKDASLFLLKNRLSGSILLKIIPSSDYFTLLDDIKHYDFHSKILLLVNNEYESSGLGNKDDDHFLEAVKLFNIKLNLLLIDEVITFHLKSKVLTDKIHEFLYEEIGYCLCTIVNTNKNPKENQKPIDKIKIKCFDLFTKLDNGFKKINKREPKNTYVENIIWE